MWDGFNQRKFPRIKLSCKVTVSTSSSQKAKIIGETENVGIGGVCLIQNRALERFSTCKIHLELDKNDAPIDCEGRVVWVVPKTEAVSSTKTPKKVYDTGIEFVDLPEADLERLKAFLQNKIPQGFQKVL